MGKMILGTVQLGMPYGVNNVSGQPDLQEAVDILDYAYQNGVSILDTASSYGDSEKIIGAYIKQNTTKSPFKICTKLPVDIGEMVISEYYEESRQNLHIDTFYVYYLHRFDQCKNLDVLQQLDRLKEIGQIRNIGVSVYQPDELGYIVERLSDRIDVVQIPFNMMDNVRWTRNGLLEEAAKKGIKIYARSIFLQGLILSDEKSDLCRKMGIVDQIAQLKKIAHNRKRQLAQLAVDFVNTIDEIDHWLVGCETVGQLEENIQLCKNAKRLERDVCEEIEKVSNSVDEKVIDPRKWNVKKN